MLALDIPIVPIAQAATTVTDPNTWVAVQTKADQMMKGLNIPVNAATQGTWPSAKNISAFEVYWWNDGQGVKTPTAATVEYLDATGKWVS